MAEKRSETKPRSTEPAARTYLKRYRTGAIPFLIARPLICGLDHSEQIDLVRGEPVRLRELLASGRLDAALLSSSDLPCFGNNLVILPAGCVASSGTALVARIFSQVKPDQINVLWADSGSRSALTLVQLLWAAQFRKHLSIIPFNAARDGPPHDAEAVLVIGDHVVARSPIGFNWQFDPAGMWHEMTGLPFVFGVWATLHPSQAAALYELLSNARRAGCEQLEEIAAEHAPSYGWPTDLAIRCLTTDIQFEFNAEQKEGLEEFLIMAAEFDLAEPITKLNYFEP